MKLCSNKMQLILISKFDLGFENTTLETTLTFGSFIFSYCMKTLSLFALGRDDLRQFLNENIYLSIYCEWLWLLNSDLWTFWSIHRTNKMLLKLIPKFDLGVRLELWRFRCRTLCSGQFICLICNYVFFSSMASAERKTASPTTATTEVHCAFISLYMYYVCADNMLSFE